MLSWIAFIWSNIFPLECLFVDCWSRMLSNSARRTFLRSLPGPDLVAKPILSRTVLWRQWMSISWLAGSYIISITNCACNVSISVFILACSASYAFLSGFPPVNVGSDSSVSFVVTGVALPLDEAAVDFPLVEGLAGIAGGSDTWRIRCGISQKFPVKSKLRMTVRIVIRYYRC